MTDRDKGDISPHPPKRQKTNNVASQHKLPVSIMLSNPRTRPESPSGKISIARFPRELSVLVDGTDIRFNLAETVQTDGAKLPIRLIFHHPFLSLSYHESYFQPTLAANVCHESQRSNSPATESLPTSSRDSPSSQKHECRGFLNNVRTTPDESRFLHAMLEPSPAPNKDGDEDLGEPFRERSFS